MEVHNAPLPWVSYTSPGAGYFWRLPARPGKGKISNYEKVWQTGLCFARRTILPTPLKVRSYIYISVYLFGRKERDIYPSYAMTLILHVNHVYKIEWLDHIFLIELSGQRCPILEGGKGRW